MLLNEGDIIAERYLIEKKIGQGGMAVVYKALDRNLNRIVTFKVMREEYENDDDYIKRFHKEARAAAQVSHQNLVNVYDVGAADGVNYIVMEYIDGLTLKDMIRKRAPFTNAETLGVAIQIATALEHAHKNQIVHRDVKPQNVLITTEGNVKITDFGIARVASDTTQIASSNTMGSVHYFSPEQAQGRYTDNKSDIYSLGIVMFEMSTGTLPFEGDTSVSIAMQHINDPLPGIRELNPDVSESIIKIIQKATEKLSSKRYQTMEDMSGDLKRAITNETGDFVDEEEEAKEPTARFTDDEMAEIRRRAKALLEDEDEKEEEEEDYYEDEDAASEKKVIVAAILTSVAIIGIILAFVIHIYGGKNRPIGNVPNLVGMNIEDAKRTGDEIGLGVSQTDHRYSDKPEGTILEQFTPVGQEFYNDENVLVIVSDGEELVAVPDLTSRTVDELEGIFKEIPLNVKVEHIYDSNTPIDVIVRQDPVRDTRVAVGSLLTVYVSNGPELPITVVPELSGKTEDEAKEILRSQGFQIGNISYEKSDEYDEGVVIEQSVPSGNRVAASSTAVGLTVSSGKGGVPPQNTGDMKTTKITLKPISLSDAGDTVEYRLVRYPSDENATATVVARDTVAKSDFPLTIEVSGTGKAEFIFSIRSGDKWKLQGSQEVDFDNL
ncbi:protein kinase [Clostridia bacterium]|nr:protein kinase [Clostridia bacterium]